MVTTFELEQNYEVAAVPNTAPFQCVCGKGLPADGEYVKLPARKPVRRHLALPRLPVGRPEGTAPNASRDLRGAAGERPGSGRDGGRRLPRRPRAAPEHRAAVDGGDGGG